jgi:hypothetical protein
MGAADAAAGGMKGRGRATGVALSEAGIQQCAVSRKNATRGSRGRRAPPRRVGAVADDQATGRCRELGRGGGAGAGVNATGELRGGQAAPPRPGHSRRTPGAAALNGPVIRLQPDFGMLNFKV